MFLLSFLPMALTYPAWRHLQRLKPPLSPVRLLIFRCGLLIAILCSISIAISTLHPFPLLDDGHGGYSDLRNFTLFEVGLYASLVIVMLSAFGRGSARPLLAATGLLLFILGYMALLSSGH